MSYTRATRSLAAAVIVAAAAMTAHADVFSGTGGDLNDATEEDIGITQFDIPVSGTDGTITSINSVTFSLTHTWVGDTVIEFFAPDGTSVSIAAPPDNESSNYNGTYTFIVDPTKQTIDEVSGPLTTSQDIPSGTYAPSDYGDGPNGPRVDYNDFVGVGLDGTWSLLISDYGEGDSGTLTSWSFDANYSVVPEPTTLATLAGVGGLGVIRRRTVR